MKALPMTMEDKCAFVDLISQNSSGGDSQEDEWLYFDVRDINFSQMVSIVSSFPYVIVNLHDDNVLKINSGQALELIQNGAGVDFIAVQAKRYIPDIFIGSSSSLTYEKMDTIKVMNMIGAKQITKEEYNSFINFTEDDFEELPLG